MKNTGLILVILISLLFNGCKKSDSGDPCVGVVCQNGGTCSNGECDCPDGYFGPECQHQLVPSKIHITKITVTSFPTTTYSGASFDPSNGLPDLLLRLYFGSALEWEAYGPFNNAHPANDYEFIPDHPIEIEDIEYQSTFSLYDYDSTDPHDLMSSIQFFPYENSNNFPAELVLDNGINTTMTVYLTYTW